MNLRATQILKNNYQKIAGHVIANEPHRNTIFQTYALRLRIDSFMACNVLSGPVGLLHTEAAMIQTTLTLPQAHVFVLKCETLQVTEFEFALIICVYIYIIISYYTIS